VIIKASKILILIYSITVPFIVFLPFVLLSESRQSWEDGRVSFYLMAVAINTVYFLFFDKQNIEISLDRKFIGSQQRKRDWKTMSRSVSVETVDLERSSSRSFYDRLTSRYVIYDTNNYGFSFYRRSFCKKDFDKIKTELFSILGIKI